MYIVWKISQSNWSVASVRYRFWNIFYFLRKKIRMAVYSGFQEVCAFEKPDIIVFVKSYTAFDLFLAREFKQRGTKVVFDLCDNIFYLPQYYSEIGNRTCMRRTSAEADTLRQIFKFVDCVTVPSENLKLELLKLFPSLPLVKVIPDSVDPGLSEPRMGISMHQKINYVFAHGYRWAIYKFLRYANGTIFSLIPRHLFGKMFWVISNIGHAVYIYLLRPVQKIFQIPSFEQDASQEVIGEDQKEIAAPLIVAKADKDPGEKKLKKLLWFGNAGREGLFGITDLVQIQAELEKCYLEEPFVLTVISNDLRLFRKFISPMKIRTKYLTWTPEIVAKELKETNIVILPNSNNSFSQCKSANRALLCLQSGVPVIASRSASLDSLSGSLLIENWAQNIKLYLNNEGLRKEHLTTAKKKIDMQFSHAEYLRSWESLFLSLVSASSKKEE